MYDEAIELHKKGKFSLSQLRHLAKRQTGVTTRIVDSLIQELFNNGECIVMDHHDSRNAEKSIFERIFRRLYFEHRIEKSQLKIDGQKLSFKDENFNGYRMARENFSRYIMEQESKLLEKNGNENK